MRYGRDGIIQKKKMLNSSTTKLGKKFSITSVKVLMITAIALIVTAGCLGLGAAQGIIASAPDITDIDVTPDGFASIVYDANGNEVQKLSTSGTNRIPVDISKVPIDLQHAFVAIEDERFYDHNGIDIKGIIRAVSVAIKNGSLSQGGSTLTQQLIKNNVFNAYNETTIEKVKRKIQEQYLAVRLETIMDKETILENYLNTINLSNGYYGVQAAANGYFGKDVSELTLSECAVIASITQNPAGLNPIKYPEKNNTRKNKVLKHMLEQEYITKEQYDEAVADDVYARIQGLEIASGNQTTYSYFVDTIIEKLIEDLMEQKGYTETQATNLVYRGGLNIYSTQDLSMQKIADTVINTDSYYLGRSDMLISNYALTVRETDNTVSYYSHYSMLEWYQKQKNDKTFSLLFKSKATAQSHVDTFRNAMLSKGGTVITETVNFTMQPQVAFTLMEQGTGHVKVIVGGRGDKTASRTLNRAINSRRQPGSSIKPLVAYGPALDTNAITLATTIDDAPYYYSGENGKLVTNVVKGHYYGLMSVREAIRVSTNVPAVKTYTKITPEVGFSYLQKFGISTLVSPKDAVNCNHDLVQALAIGGMTYGVHNIEMTAAFAAIANKGQYVEPVYYTKVTDSDGNILIDNSQPETHSVIKETTSWLLTSAMQSVTASGMGGLAKVSNQATAGKTGTSSNNTDRYFCGYTPYYTASIWMGNDNSEGMYSEYIVTPMWGKIMNEIHKNLPTKDFEQPSGIVKMEVCAQSGKLHVPGLCDNDPRGDQLTTEYFAIDNIPTETCDTHVKVNICNDTGEVACSKCPNYTTKVFIKKAELLYATDESGSVVYTTDDHEYAITESQLTKLCSLHGSSFGSSGNISGGSTDDTDSETGDTTGGTTSGTIGGTTGGATGDATGSTTGGSTGSSNASDGNTTGNNRYNSQQPYLNTDDTAANHKKDDE